MTTHILSMRAGLLSAIRVIGLLLNVFLVAWLASCGVFIILLGKDAMVEVQASTIFFILASIMLSFLISLHNLRPTRTEGKVV